MAGAIIDIIARGVTPLKAKLQTLEKDNADLAARVLELEAQLSVMRETHR